jgi:hypothetical protein
MTNNMKSKNGDGFQASEEAPAVYRPDQPHLQMSSPAKGAGIKNKQNDNTEIR